MGAKYSENRDLELPAHKKRYSLLSRIIRGIFAVVDPRAYFHALRIINYYNYSHVIPRRKIKIGINPRISPNASFSNPERIHIGNNVSIGAHCQIWAGPSKGKIIIGDDVLLGPDIMMTAASYRFNDGAPVTNQPMDESDITIGNDVWIGAKAIILPGAIIGDGSIIGAGSLVRGEIPKYSIAVGTPAKIVGERHIEIA